MLLEQLSMKTGAIKTILKASLVLIFGLLLVITLLSITIIHTSHRSTTILVPMTLNAPTTVSTDDVSPTYLTMMGRSLISLRFDFTPKTIQAQYQSLENFISPDVYTRISAELQDEEKSMIDQNIMSSFAVTDIVPDVNNLNVKVSGILTRWVQGAALNPVETTFELKFINENGTLVLTDWLEQKK